LTHSPVPSRVLVKVCGLTTPAEALACARAGVDWIGLNFHPASPRYVTPEIAAEIAATLPDECSAVGLFVNRPTAEVLDIASRVGLRLIQLHGDEPAQDLVTLATLRVVRAFRLGDRAAVDRMSAYLRQAEALGSPPFAALIDGYVSGQAGGTGRAIDADILDVLPPVPRLILAGGLNPVNVAARVARVRPWMVDVASGVESSPGRKDPEKVAAFVRAARGA
jgi:phosphoribosylanthranilate isomerase